MAHEMAHDAIARGDINLDEIRTMLEEQFTAAELDDMAAQYAAAFTTADGKCVMTAEEAFEEICCDAKLTRAEPYRLSATLFGAFRPFRLDGRQPIFVSKAENPTKIAC